MIELAGEVADGALLFVGLHPAAVRAARRHLEVARSERGDRWTGFRWCSSSRSVWARTMRLARDGCEAGSRRDSRSSCYPSASNLRWLREAGFDLAADHDPPAISEDEARQIADAFGLFGSAERCAERLLQAQAEAGVEDVFLFPAHDLRRRL